MKTAIKFLCGLLAPMLAAVSGWFGLYWYPYGQALELDERFNLVWSDEFGGASLDQTKWRNFKPRIDEADPAAYDSGVYPLPYRDGSWHQDTMSFDGGSLVIETRYEPEGLGGGGPGWYSHAVSTRGLHEFLHGYFEVRCILPEGRGLWSAFWMLCADMGNPPAGGASGAEVDIFESPHYHQKGWNRNSVSSAVHINGYGAFHESRTVGSFRLKNNPYKEYNTYGVEWNENEYIFYINGVESGRTGFGVSERPLYLILSTEVGAEDTYGWAGNINDNKTLAGSKYIVDYVRVYQYK